jgi:hypothetical protein
VEVSGFLSTLCCPLSDEQIKGLGRGRKWKPRLKVLVILSVGLQIWRSAVSQIGWSCDAVRQEHSEDEERFLVRDTAHRKASLYSRQAVFSTSFEVPLFGLTNKLTVLPVAGTPAKSRPTTASVPRS